MLYDIRQNYERSSLEREELASDPIVQFQHWLDLALDSDILEANAMTLATVGTDGMPSARMVLLKGVSQAGFDFYSNYQSRKAKEIEMSGKAALVFYWDILERQVRVEGSIAKTSREQSERYFQSRPRGSQLGAMASPQSQVIDSRQVLEERQQALAERYPEALPVPEHWGGYRVSPLAIEFWQGRQNRLHDRFRYTLEEDRWRIERLAP